MSDGHLHFPLPNWLDWGTFWSASGAIFAALAAGASIGAWIYIVRSDFRRIAPVLLFTCEVGSNENERIAGALLGQIHTSRPATENFHLARLKIPGARVAFVGKEGRPPMRNSDYSGTLSNVAHAQRPTGEITRRFWVRPKDPERFSASKRKAILWLRADGTDTLVKRSVQIKFQNMHWLPDILPSLKAKLAD